MREQFTFYRSWWEAASRMKKTDRQSFLEAIISFALDGKEPQMTDAAAGAFLLVKPTISSAARKSQGAKNKPRESEDDGKIE